VEWRRFHRKFAPDVTLLFDPEKSLARREIPGAPGPKQVSRQLARWEKELGGPR
jgi:argininosuccinate lyase